MRRWLVVGLAVQALCLQGSLAGVTGAGEVTNDLGQTVKWRRPARFDSRARIDPEAVAPIPPSFGAEDEVPIQTPLMERGAVAVPTVRDPLRAPVSSLTTPDVELSVLGYDSDDNAALLGVRWRPPDSKPSPKALIRLDPITGTTMSFRKNSTTTPNSVSGPTPPTQRPHPGVNRAPTS